MGPERDDDGPLRLRRARFLFLCGAAVVGVARRRRVHGTVDCLCSKIGLVDRLKVARAATAVQNISRAGLCWLEGRLGQCTTDVLYLLVCLQAASPASGRDKRYYDALRLSTGSYFALRVRGLLVV